MALVEIPLGAALVFWVALEAFESVVLPRRVTRPFRLSRLYYRAAWRFWRGLSDLLPVGAARQSVLSAFGPLSLLALFGLWAAGLVVGFAALHRAAWPGELSWDDALYFSGTTFTTLGYGDLSPHSLAERLPADRLLALCDALRGRGAGAAGRGGPGEVGGAAGALRAVRGGAGAVLPVPAAGGLAGGGAAGQLADQQMGPPGRPPAQPGCRAEGRPLRVSPAGFRAFPRADSLYHFSFRPRRGAEPTPHLCAVPHVPHEGFPSCRSECSA